MRRFNAAFFAVLSNRPREAIGFLERLDPDRGVVRGWVPYWLILAASYEQLGEYREVLEVIERGKERFPNYYWPGVEMVPLAALGRVGDVEERLDNALERGSRRSALRAANALRAFGHLEAATRAARRVVDYFETHDSTDAVWEPYTQGGQAAGLRLILADALSLEGRFDEAERIYHELAQQFPDRIAQELEAWERPYLWGRHLAWSARIAAAEGSGERNEVMVTWRETLPAVSAGASSGRR
jgi:tetratricopeptide (TPR) repeat protein